MEKNTPSNRKSYKLITQYEGSSAEIGEIVSLSNFGEYCPENSLRGYTVEEIETNPCWQLVTATPSNTPVEEKKQLLERAKKDYPEDTEVLCACACENKFLIVGGLRVTHSGNIEDHNGTWVYYNGHWAEKVTTPVHEAKDNSRIDEAGFYVTESLRELAKVEGEIKSLSAFGGGIYIRFETATYRVGLPCKSRNKVSMDEAKDLNSEDAAGPFRQSVMKILLSYFNDHCFPNQLQEVADKIVKAAKTTNQ